MAHFVQAAGGFASCLLIFFVLLRPDHWKRLRCSSTFFPDVGSAPWFSNLSVGLAAAARPVPKTLAALAGAEPLAQAAEVQRLQFFLCEAVWDAEAINARRLALLATSASVHGVYIIDDTGHRKDGSTTNHVARQYLGSVGKIDNRIVTVTTLCLTNHL